MEKEYEIELSPYELYENGNEIEDIPIEQEYLKDCQEIFYF